MDKSADAFRTIGEVSGLLDTPAHVLRFWESRFPQIRPIKRAGGRRYYRPADVALLGGIRRLLHDDGLTIRGVQKMLREKGVRHVAGLSGLATPAQDGARGEGARDDGAYMPDASPGAAPQAAAGSPVRDGDDLFGDPGMDDEAPMELDAVEPQPAPADIHRMPRPADDRRATVAPATPAAPVPDDAPAREPAATLLRAMDAMRARDKRGELREVYDRLNRLRDRVAGAADRGRP